VEQSETAQKLTIRIPEDVAYRPLGDAGEVPERFSAVVQNLPAASGVTELKLDMEFNDKNGRFRIVNVAMRAKKGQSVNLEGIRTAYLPAFREATRRVVRARMDAVDNRGASTLEKVARIYRLAQAAGESPTKAVAEQLDISRDAAAQQVSRARKAGLLPKARLVRGPTIWERQGKEKNA
jgi:hypothetical protein